jgi:hypothetical protein
MDSLPAPIQTLRSFYDDRIAQHRTTLLTTAAALFMAPLLSSFYADYKNWLTLGRGGLPYNIFGWIFQSVLRPLNVKQLDTSCFDSAEVKAEAGAYAKVSFLKEEDLPPREGFPERPKFGPWILPQRQLSMSAEDDIKSVRAPYLTSSLF